MPLDSATLAVAPLALLPDWLDPTNLLESLGTWAFVGALIIIFAECGLLVGFFLPGDSLLFAVGLFIAQGSIDVNIWVAALLLAVAAVAGNLVGYAVGAKFGPPLFSKPDSRIFKRQHVERTSTFFEKYGARAIVMARFVPIVRTFITAMAGVGRMNFRTFALFSAVGGVLWAAGLTILGYFLGNNEFVKSNVEIILILIVVISVVPMILEWWFSRRSGHESVKDAAIEIATGVDLDPENRAR